MPEGCARRSPRSSRPPVATRPRARASPATWSKSNLTGHDSHGVIRVPRYVHWLDTGAVYAGRSVKTVMDAGAVAVLDGDHGFGQTIGEQAMTLAVEKAREFGVAVVGLRNSGHLGRIGDWAELAAAEGLISIHFVNTSGLGMLVAPFGGTERRMSTNPISIGVPMPEGPPLVLDCATSIVAEGKVLVALNGGKPLPDGALIERDGGLTTDPNAIYGAVDGTQPHDQRTGSAAVRAMGEHKGSGISIMCELLAGALTGGGCGRAGHKTLENNMLSILLDPARFGTEALLWPEIDRYIEFVRSARDGAGAREDPPPRRAGGGDARTQAGKRGPAASQGAGKPGAHGELARPRRRGGGVQAGGGRVGGLSFDV